MMDCVGAYSTFASAREMMDCVGAYSTFASAREMMDCVTIFASVREMMDGEKAPGPQSSNLPQCPTTTKKTSNPKAQTTLIAIYDQKKSTQPSHLSQLIKDQPNLLDYFHMLKKKL
jgi:hypothetical protein